MVDFLDACCIGDVKTVSMLIWQADPSELEGLVGFASANGHTEMVRFLLNSSRIKTSHINALVDPSENDNWAIRIASQNGYVEIVRLLLADPRVDPFATNNWAIRYASENGHIEVVRLLLEDSRVDPSDQNNYAIRCASLNRHLGVVRLLLTDYRVDPSDKPSIIFRSAIEWTEDPELLQLLTEHLYRLDGPIYNEGIL